VVSGAELASDASFAASGMKAVATAAKWIIKKAAAKALAGAAVPGMLKGAAKKKAKDAAINTAEKEVAAKTGAVAPNAIPKISLAARIQAKLGLYPKVIDPRTGRSIPFPSGITGRVAKSLRVAWDSGKDKAAFIREWYRRGYPTPDGGWRKYDIHHILPIEFGGTNDFWNLVPVERNTHQTLFNAFWREFTSL
jgi:hypothetical protein